MDSQATQPATQPILDPRRIGQNASGLNEKDAADILAILHPASPAAIKIVESAAEERRQHVLLRNPYDTYSEDFTDIEEQETIILHRSDDRFNPTSRTGADLALRMSSHLIKPSLGFVFGRNQHSADIVFTQDAGKRISNQHFRIFLNSDAILMLEDMSTNGTLVDEVLLKCRDPRFSKVRMLGAGSIICIQNSADAEMIKFIVRIPSRVTQIDRFEENVRNFLTRCAVNGDQLKAVQRLSKHQLGGTAMKWDGGDRYNIIGQLGKGAFATVYQLATKMEGKLLAAKELEKRRFMKNGQLDKKVDNEMKIMQHLRHPNIVEFVEYHDQGDHLYIVMEFVRYGDLQGFLNEQGSLSESQARTMAQQLLSALSYLHRAQITHRDIKPDNILIAELEPFRVKLSDFGLSKVVKHDETFLKTFCGTLLYCAPEVFPDFDGKSKGIKRRRGAKQYHSYSSSVDIWSFAAVLWFSLCGKPPFEGIADATGKAMYNNIMSTRLDPTPLREAGVSELCIDLLCSMLQTDPAHRPTDRDCLRHPWLKDGAVIPDDPVLQSIVEEVESEEAGEQLSQLSLHGEDQDEEEYDEASELLEDEEFEALVNARATKKVRTDPLFPRHQMRDTENTSSAEPSFAEPFSDSRNAVDESFKLMPKGRQRLFGEVGESAVSGSVVENAQTDTHASKIVYGSVVPESMPAPHLPQLDGAFSSPSLLGAESMVRDLNMQSPQSPQSGTHTNEPATPKTPEVLQHSSLRNTSKGASQVSEATPKAKPPSLTRQISLPKTKEAPFYYDPSDPDTHTLEYASKLSGIDFISTEGSVTSGQDDDEAIADTVRFSESVESGNTSTDNDQFDAEEATPVPPKGVDPTTDSFVTPASESLIRPPPRRLGKLIATADSFVPNLTLMIDQSRTTWGRHPSNTLVYEDKTDTRIPKTAFNIFWYTSDPESNNVRDLSQQGRDWTTLPGLQVGIFNCATSGISINGTHLRQKDDKGRALFGHLHSGDIIQVYHDKRGTEGLRFKCEFYHGLAKEPRPPGTSFQILMGGKIVQ